VELMLHEKSVKRNLGMPSGTKCSNCAAIKGQFPKDGVVSMGRCNTCSTGLLAGVLRAKVGREG
jgi:hypothetical protein